MNPAEIRALAYVVNNIRPSWPVRDIERALVDDPRVFTDVALAAVTAAASPDTRFPGGIKTTYAGSHGCQKCAERDSRAERNSQPPPIQRCAKCGRATDLDHACRSAKPPWWPQAQAISNQYATAIRAARAVGDHATVAELAANQRTELAKVMAHA